MKITQEMTNELNVVLANMGCSFKFHFREEPLNNMIDVEPMNSKYIHSSIINLTDDFYKFLEEFFKSKGIKELTYNNTGSTIWSKDGWSVE